MPHRDRGPGRGAGASVREPEEGPSDGEPSTEVAVGWRSGAWVAVGVFSALALLALVRSTAASLTSVGVGLLLAFALDPLVVRAKDRIGCSRAVAVGLVGSAFLVGAALLVVVLGPPAVRQAGEFGRELPSTVEDLYDLPLVGPALEDRDAVGAIERWVDELPARVNQDTIRDAAERLVGGVLSGLVVSLIGVAVLLDGDRLVRRLLEALPDRIEPRAVRAGRIFYRTIGAYFSGSLLVAACTASFILAAGLALGVPLAPAAALWALVVSLIPQIGGFLTGAFFGMLGFAAGPSTGIACVLLYVVWMNFENHVLGPAIVGEAVDLSPPTTMVAALVGGAAAGVPGALVATPLCGAVKVIYLEVRYGPTEAAERKPAPWNRWRQALRRRKDKKAGRAPATPERTPANTAAGRPGQPSRRTPPKVSRTPQPRSRPRRRKHRR